MKNPFRYFKSSPEIIRLADDVDADMIVVGDTGRSSVGRLLLGSVSNQVVHHSQRSVLVVRSGQADPSVQPEGDSSEGPN